MTYCIGIKLKRGLVFLSDSRTNAGVDQVSVFRKMMVFEKPGERVLVLMTAGNLAISQAVLHRLQQVGLPDGDSLWNAPDLFEAARFVGKALREIYEQEAAALKEQGIEFNVSLLLGGQIKGDCPRMFQIYAAGNFIEAHNETPYLQIGESKYGKPLLDRMINEETKLDEAAKCALISMDSTLRSNISVGLPLDLLVYERDSLKVTRFSNIDERNEYFRMIQNTWSDRLRQVFNEIPDPSWANPEDSESLVPPGPTHQPLRARATNAASAPFAQPQQLAENEKPDQQNG